MNVTITDQEQCKKEVRLEIPSDDVRTELDKTAQKFARTIALPGFRPGRVPPSVIKSRFRKELHSEVASALLPDAFQKTVAEKKLRVVGEPSLVEFNFGEDESLTAVFAVETAPEFELSNYKGIPLKKKIRKITDEEVERALDAMREEQAEMVPVEDRAAQPGDVLTANLTFHYLDTATQSAEPATEEAESGEKKDTTKTAETEKAEELTDQEIFLGSDEVGKQITDALAGASVGDRREFTIDYPADYTYEKLAGRKVSYKTEITAIRFKEVPEADDQFAKSIDEKYNTLEDLRAEIRSNIEQEAGMVSERELRAVAAKHLTENNRFDVPEAAVEIGVRQGLRAFVHQFRSRGIPLDLREADVERMRQMLRPQAEEDARMAFILDKIAEVESVEATEEEIEHEIEHLAEANNQSPTAMKALLTKEGALDTIKDQIKTRKALDLVVASAQIETEEVESVKEENNSQSEVSQEASE